MANSLGLLTRSKTSQRWPWVREKKKQ